MNTLSIPNSSVTITRLGFGCARIFGGSERRSTQKLIEAAIDCGIRHFDTAPAYGSEDVLGEVLAGERSVTIATKIGLARPGNHDSPLRKALGRTYRRTLRPLLSRTPGLKSKLLRVTARRTPPRTPQKRTVTAQEVLRELEESMRRLRRSKVDLYLLHEPDAIEVTDELRELFVSLQKDNLIGAFGLAFGASAAHAAPFGSVVQCRLTDVSVPVRPEATTILHGVVRFGLQSLPGETLRNPATLVAETLLSYPGTAIIFSASTPRQVQQISKSCHG